MPTSTVQGYGVLAELSSRLHDPSTVEGRCSSHQGSPVRDLRVVDTTRELTYFGRVVIDFAERAAKHPGLLQTDESGALNGVRAEQLRELGCACEDCDELRVLQHVGSNHGAAESSAVENVHLDRVTLARFRQTDQ